jgi:hypothetical protein
VHPCGCRWRVVNRTSTLSRAKLSVTKGNAHPANWRVCLAANSGYRRRPCSAGSRRDRTHAPGSHGAGCCLLAVNGCAEPADSAAPHHLRHRRTAWTLTRLPIRLCHLKALYSISPVQPFVCARITRSNADPARAGVQLQIRSEHVGAQPHPCAACRACTTSLRSAEYKP